MRISWKWMGIAPFLCFLTATSATAGEPGVLGAADDVVTDGVWTYLEAAPEPVEFGEPWIRPVQGNLLHLDSVALQDVLSAAPLEFTDEAEHVISELLLPTPHGDFEAFTVVESPVMAPALAARYPEIKTYFAQGVDDPHASARLDFTPKGFHAQVLGSGGAWYIDPYTDHNVEYYSVYAKRDLEPTNLPGCDLRTIEGNDWPSLRELEEQGVAVRTSGANLRTYQLACAATGEYTQFHGGTVALGQAAIVTAINRVTGIYEVEFAARLELVPNNDSLVFTNGGTDPYTNNNGGAMLSQNQSTIDSIIGSANYDIGHVFSTGGGGVAFLGVVCTNGSKAGGVTGLPSPIGDPFYVDYAAHEMGHQFGSNHNFNGVNGSCSGGNRNGATANEPGSGSTIMGYAGICGADNIQNNSDAYFNGISYDEVRALMTSRSCHVQTSTGNNAPNVDAGPNYTIPQSTPFALTASATDPQGDPLEYCWEQMDTGPAQALSAGDNGSSPLFRSRPPRTSEVRNMPRLIDIRNNVSSDTEKLPTTNRTMTFRCTARDNRAGGGGVDQDEMVITVIASADPFLVTSPNTSVTWGGTQTVTWDVAGTSGGSINATNVEIALSTNSGQTFDTILEASTPNDGIQTVVLPNINTTTARIRVMPTNNIFFDMSNQDFTIEPPAISVAVTSAVPTELAPSTPLVVDAEISDGFETVVSGSETLYYRFDGGAFTTITMTPQGGDQFQATIPGAACGDTVEFYVEADASGGSTITDPSDAPTTLYAVGIGVTTNVLVDNFQTDQGWAALDDGLATSGFWQRGVPVDDPTWEYDPASDSDGSGSCYLTQNENGNTDVDDGTVRLRSPQFDMSAPGDYTVSYDYFLRLTNDDGTDQLLVEMRDQVAGTGWMTIAVHTTDGGLSWRSNTLTQTDLDNAGITLSSQMQIRFSANDGNPQSINEAGVDAVSITGYICESTCADSDGDGVCDPNDICPGGDDNVDGDGDGVPDFCDSCPLDNPDDSDGDGVCDSADICPGGDDNADADGDGVPDFCDVCPNDNPDDSDGDGVCDSADICPGGDDNADADGDGVPDFCDACPNDNPDDSDGDGVCDSADICPGGDDNDDADGDGVPDFCDACPNDNPDDSDGDGVCDSADICPGGDDNDDVDGDGVPDFCDACPNDNPDDSDGDGVCDSADICPGGDDTVDTDGDGVPDFCDACPNDNPDDSDGDGVCDSADICAGGDDNADADGDGVPDFCDQCPGGDDNVDDNGNGVPDACECDADLNDDGVIDISDLALVLAEFGQTGPGLTGDVDGDEDVDLSDLAAVLASFGETCTP